MKAATAEQRREREAEFHDRWAADIRPDNTLVDETFTAPTAVENQHILKQFGDVEGKRLLDYGCGAAEGGIYFAKRGAKVVGVDVSAGMLDSAQRLARHHGVELETRQVTGDRIPAEDSEFDFIYGNGVLHHVDHAMARRELARILQPGGTACFIEPLTYNPVIEVYRHLAGTARTEDESPLRFSDIALFREHFGMLEHREFWLTTLAVFLKFYLLDRADPSQERYWKKIYTDAEALRWFHEPLRRLDALLLRKLPLLGHLCWTTVITVREPHH